MARLIPKVWQEDPLLFPRSGMRIISFIMDQAFIDKILHDLGFKNAAP